MTRIRNTDLVVKQEIYFSLSYFYAVPHVVDNVTMVSVTTSSVTIQWSVPPLEGGTQTLVAYQVNFDGVLGSLQTGRSAVLNMPASTRKPFRILTWYQVDTVTSQEYFAITSKLCYLLAKFVSLSLKLAVVQFS